MIAKASLLRVHKWCGLVACALLAIQAATGLVEAYRHDIAQLVDPAGLVREAGISDAALRQVQGVLQSTYPQQRVERIVFPENATGTYFVHLIDASGDTNYVSIDPGTAAVLRYGSIWAFPAEAAARIHYNYTIGIPGMLIIALAGLLGLVMAVTGILYWWPPAGRRVAQLRINWRLPGRFILRQLHRSTGVLMVVVLFFSLATGLALAIYYIDAAAVATSVTPVATRGPDALDADEVLARARTIYPDAAVRDVRFPAPHRADVWFHAPERNPRAAHLVSVNLRDGSLATTLDAADNTALWMTLLPLHSAELLGAFGKVLVTVSGLILLFLALSGPIIWWRRVASKR